MSRYSYAGNNPLSFLDPFGRFFGLISQLGLGGGVVQSALSNDWSIGNFISGTLKGWALGAAIMGVAAVAGAVGGGLGASGFAPTVTITGFSGQAVAVSSGLAAAGAGLLAPGASAYLVAIALSIPAGIGLFDPNANESLKGFARGFLVAGALGSFAQASLVMSMRGALGSQLSAVYTQFPEAALAYGAQTEMAMSFMGDWAAKSAVRGAVSLIPLVQ